jgi:hypothetical protein
VRPSSLTGALGPRGMEPSLGEVRVVFPLGRTKDEEGQSSRVRVDSTVSTVLLHNIPSFILCFFASFRCIIDAKRILFLMSFVQQKPYQISLISDIQLFRGSKLISLN